MNEIELFFDTKQEHDIWVHEGVTCLVLAHHYFDAYMGYVLVPEGHLWNKIEPYHRTPVDVHGGLTFDQYTKSGDRWIGFDCMHGGDLVFNINPIDRLASSWTKQMVKEETERLARQIAKGYDADR